jgi:hypothetical protein
MAADGHGPPAPFETMDEAAIAGIKVAIGESRRYEYGGAIIQVAGGYYATLPVTIGDPNAFKFRLDRRVSPVGVYHTHPAGGWYSDIFSPHDLDVATARGIRSYVGFIADRSIRVFDPNSMQPKFMGRGAHRIPNTRGSEICRRCF